MCCGGNDPRTSLVILLFVVPVAKGHTIAGRGGRIVFGSILVPGMITVLVTTGAPPFCRAECDGWRSVCVAVAPVAKGHTIAGRGGRIVFGSILVPVMIMVLVMAGASPIRRAEYE